MADSDHDPEAARMARERLQRRHEEMGTARTGPTYEATQAKVSTSDALEVRADKFRAEIRKRRALMQDLRNGLTMNLAEYNAGMERLERSFEDAVSDLQRRRNEMEKGVKAKIAENESLLDSAIAGLGALDGSTSIKRDFWQGQIDAMREKVEKIAHHANAETVRANRAEKVAEELSAKAAKRARAPAEYLARASEIPGVKSKRANAGTSKSPIADEVIAERRKPARRK